MKHRLLSAVLCVLLLLTALPLSAMAATTGTVYGLDSGSSLNLRKEPTTSADNVIGKLYNGDKVTILETSKDKKWYQVKTSGGTTAWASAEFIRIDEAEEPEKPEEPTPTYKTDEEFEAYLTAQKFPESYKVALRQLFAVYPQWIFKAQHLSMTWEEALNSESVALKNALNTNDHPESWLSMEYGAYNWSTGKYVAVDSGGWVTASREITAYFMDPRNWLDKTYIFQFEDLLYSDHHTVEGIKAILPSRYDNYAADVLKAAKDANVSAYFLATRMTQEGAKVDGTFEGDDGVNYDGYYNFFNYGAYAGSQHGSYHGANTNGAIYAKKQGWDTPYKCILGSAEKIGSGYIHKKQNTLYHQKFNVAGENLYNHQYMSNVNAPSSESKIRVSKATEEELQSPITFIIPVYKDMPEQVAIKPSSTGNNNNFLDSLTVEGFEVSPTFDRYTMEYAAEVTKETTEVTISAKANYDKAKVEGTGTIQLYAGENLLPITVTATSGQVRTYTLSVFCAAEDAPERPEEPPTTTDKPTDSSTTTGSGTASSDTTDTTTATTTTTTTAPPKPTVSAKAYTIDKTVSGVAPETAPKDFLAALTVKDGTAKLMGSDGKEKKEGVVGTGDTVQILTKDNKVHATYAIIVYGDVNGDGKVNSQDLRRAQRHILAVAELKDAYLSATDTNIDGKVNSQDLRRIQRYILKAIDTLYSPKED